MKIEIELGGKKIELSPEEAKHLFTELKRLFGDDGDGITIKIPPKPPSPYPFPIWQQPAYTHPPYWTVTTSGTTDIQ